MILTFLVSSCAPSFAQMPRKGQGMHHKGLATKCSTLENLGLSEEQRDSLKRLDDRFKDRILDLRNTLMLKRLELRGLLRDPGAEQDAIQTKSGEMGALREVLQQKILDYQLEIRRILTPDQIERWCPMTGGPVSRGGWNGKPWCR